MSGRTAVAWIAPLAALLAGCSSCGSTASPAPDARLGDRPRPRPDQPRESEGADANLGGCGGSRKLTPESVPPGTNKPCGPGCEEIGHLATGYSYEVAGDLLVYGGMDGPGVGYHAVLIDLKSRSESIIHRSQKTPGGGCIWVDTDGTRLAYSCGTLVAPGTVVATLQVYDPATREETDLRCFSYSGKGTAPMHVALADTGVAAQISFEWDAAVDIYFYRFSDKSFTNLTKQRGGIWESNAHGPLLTWTRSIKEESRTAIILHDTRDGTTRPLEAGSTAKQWAARIEGDKIVWVDHRNAPGDMWTVGNADIYMHDLSTGKTMPVTTHPARQDSPDLSGDWVVWEDFRHNPNPTTPSGQGRIDIYAKNMKTGVEVQLSDDTLRNELKLEVNKPRVDNGRVFFKGGSHIFMIDLAKRGL